ncbi:MAG: hypothetical protein FWH48_02290 [Oscillospiraceae bacterium]|nr:hypothetical protein [Oscillospiraceae bacterium]
MKKYELREQGFSILEKTPKKRMINVLWLIFTLLLIVGTYVALTFLIGYSPEGSSPGAPIDIDANVAMIPVYFIVLVLCVFVYFFLKLGATLLFCRDRENSARLKMLEDQSLPIFPVCFCREALRTWQTVFIYGAPIAAVYAFMFWLCGLGGSVPFETVDAGFMCMLFFMSFFMGLDLTLVAYSLFYKIKEKTDYISIDYHIYGVTLFKKTYVKFKRRPNKFLHENNKLIDNGKFRWKRQR